MDIYGTAVDGWILALVAGIWLVFGLYELGQGFFSLSRKGKVTAVVAFGAVASLVTSAVIRSPELLQTIDASAWAFSALCVVALYILAVADEIARTRVGRWFLQLVRRPRP